MSSEKVKGAGQGAMSGASAGASVGAVVGGPVGAAVGAVIGAVVGGVAGVFAGGHAKKAKKAMKRAAAIQQEREKESYRQQLLSQIRQARIARASNLAAAVAAGIEEGSGSQGAMSSIGSQISNVVEYMSVDRGRAVEIANLYAKAKKEAKMSNDQMQTIQTTSAIIGGVGAGMNIYAAGANAAAGEGAKAMAEQSTMQSSLAASSNPALSASLANSAASYTSQAAAYQTAYNWNMVGASIGLGGISSGTQTYLKLNK